MIKSELHHERPPLVGVIKEFEALQEIDAFFSTHDTKQTSRFRQAVGVLVRIHMEQQGWQKTGKKGSLGSKTKSKLDISAQPPSQNTSGLSKWFTRSERYKMLK